MRWCLSFQLTVLKLTWKPLTLSRPVPSVSDTPRSLTTSISWTSRLLTLRPCRLLRWVHWKPESWHIVNFAPTVSDGKLALSQLFSFVSPVTFLYIYNGNWNSRIILMPNLLTGDIITTSGDASDESVGIIAGFFFSVYFLQLPWHLHCCHQRHHWLSL